MNRFVFRPVLVTNGNFKADHVKQKKDEDIWLLDGGGMVPNQQEYAKFLKTALEIPTVSRSHSCVYSSCRPAIRRAPQYGRIILCMILMIH